MSSDDDDAGMVDLNQSDNSSSPSTPSPVRRSPRHKKTAAEKPARRLPSSSSSSGSSKGKAKSSSATASTYSGESSADDFETNRARTKAATGKKKKKKTAAKAVAKPVWKLRGRNYGEDELLHLFQIMERIIPIGKEEWDRTEMEHNKTFPGRTAQQLRRQYNEKAKKSIPTGNPNCPAEVKAAKRVRRLMIEKADLAEGDSGDELAVEDDFLEVWGSGDRTVDSNDSRGISRMTKD